MQISQDGNVGPEVDITAGDDGRRVEELAVDVRIEPIAKENIAAVVAVEGWRDYALVANATEQLAYAVLASCV